MLDILYDDCPKTELWISVEPFLNNIGASVLSWKESSHRNSLAIDVTIFSENGVSLSFMEKVHNLLLPRLEALKDDKKVILNISSPGVNRFLRSFYELSFFKGRLLEIRLKDELEPIEGVLHQINDTDITLKISSILNDDITIKKSSVRRIKLK